MFGFQSFNSSVAIDIGSFLGNAIPHNNWLIFCESGIFEFCHQTDVQKSNSSGPAA